MHRHLILPIILSISLFLEILLAENAYAYLDPGTGSYVFQLLVGFLMGAFLAIKIFWGRIKTFLTNIFLRWRKK